MSEAKPWGIHTRKEQEEWGGCCRGRTVTLEFLGFIYFKRCQKGFVNVPFIQNQGRLLFASWQRKCRRKITLHRHHNKKVFNRAEMCSTSFISDFFPLPFSRLRIEHSGNYLNTQITDTIKSMLAFKLNQSKTPNSLMVDFTKIKPESELPFYHANQSHL